jgi:predicted dehydrogenase
VKLAVLGLGSAGQRHAQHLIGLGHEVVGHDPDPDRSSPGIQTVASAEAALGAAEAVVVAGPSSTHAESALAAIAAGKHVLCEKPLATSGDDARRVAAAAEQAAVVCGVAMNLRFHPGVLELRRLLDAGELGRPYLAQASMGYALPLWRPGSDYRQSYSARAELGGGIIWDAIHELDYLLWLLGPVDTVSAEAGRVSDLEIDVEDTAMAVLRFASGPMAAVDLNFVEPAYRRGCVVAGSDASARWDWNEGTVVVRREGEHERVLDAACELDDTYRAVVEDFAAAITDRRPPCTPAADGVAAVALAEAMHDSAREGKRVKPA